jgi:hypothetical protein
VGRKLQSLWLPEKLNPGEDAPVAVGIVDAAASEFGLAVPFPRWARIVLRTINAWRPTVGLERESPTACAGNWSAPRAIVRGPPSRSRKCWQTS